MESYKYVRTATPFQVDIGHRLGLDLAGETYAVAAAKILDVVGPAIGNVCRYEHPTEKQITFGNVLGLDLRSQTFRVASAMLEDALLDRNQRAIERMDLKPGDRVVKRHRFEHNGKVHKWEQEFVVSSISSDGLVYFKGSGCRCAWASTIDEKISSKHSGTACER